MYMPTSFQILPPHAGFSKQAASKPDHQAPEAAPSKSTVVERPMSGSKANKRRNRDDRAREQQAMIDAAAAQQGMLRFA